MNNLKFAIVIKLNDEVIDKKKGQLMKKILILAGIVGLMSATTQVFAQEEVVPAPVCPVPCEKAFKNKPCKFGKMPKRPDFEAFEQKLKLTDEQKTKAQAIREHEKEQIKPILDKIGEKLKEEKAVMDKRLTFDERQAELAPIRKEIHELKGQIHKIKKESRAEFEAILTSKQVKQLNKMKADGMKRFKNSRPCQRFENRPPRPQGCWENPPRPEIAPEED